MVQLRELTNELKYKSISPYSMQMQSRVYRKYKHRNNKLEGNYIVVDISYKFNLNTLENVKLLITIQIESLMSEPITITLKEFREQFVEVLNN